MRAFESGKARAIFLVATFLLHTKPTHANPGQIAFQNSVREIKNSTHHRHTGNPKDDHQVHV